MPDGLDERGWKVGWNEGHMDQKGIFWYSQATGKAAPRDIGFFLRFPSGSQIHTQRAHKHPLSLSFEEELGNRVFFKIMEGFF